MYAIRSYYAVATLLPRPPGGETMPFIRIASLPFEQPVDIAAVVRAVNRDLAAATRIDLRITSYNVCYTKLLRVHPSAARHRPRDNP